MGNGDIKTVISTRKGRSPKHGRGFWGAVLAVVVVLLAGTGLLILTQPGLHMTYAAGVECGLCHWTEARQWASAEDSHSASVSEILGVSEHNKAEVPKDNCLLCHSAFQFYQFGGSVDPSGTQPGQIPKSNYGEADSGGEPFYAAAVSHFVSPITTAGPWTTSNAGDWDATGCKVCHNPSATNTYRLAKYGSMLDATFYVPGKARLDNWYPSVGAVGYFDPTVASSTTNGMPDVYQYVINPSTGATSGPTFYAYGLTTEAQATKLCLSCHNPDDQGGDPSKKVHGVDYGPQGGDSRSFVTTSHVGLQCITCHQGHTFAPILQPTKSSLCNRAHCHDGLTTPMAGPGVVHVNHIP
jgi:hypothetical protein